MGCGCGFVVCFFFFSALCCGCQSRVVAMTIGGGGYGVCFLLFYLYCLYYFIVLKANG